MKRNLLSLLLDIVIKNLSQLLHTFEIHTQIAYFFSMCKSVSTKQIDILDLISKPLLIQEYRFRSVKNIFSERVVMTRQWKSGDFPLENNWDFIVNITMKKNRGSTKRIFQTFRFIGKYISRLKVERKSSFRQIAGWEVFFYWIIFGPYKQN